jgi:AraC family transcriptional regulator
MPLDCCPDPLELALARKAEHGRRGSIEGKTLASGSGWRVVDFVCTCGPRDERAEERHTLTSVSLVLAGTFVCRTHRGRSLLSAGSLFLGSAGEAFECSHEHGEGDRCLSFQFDPELFEQIAGDVGSGIEAFGRDNLPPVRPLAKLVARAINAISQPAELEDVAYELAGAALAETREQPAGRLQTSTLHQRRVAEVVRHMERRMDERHAISDLARRSGISPYHFVRVFRSVTGATPHQWLLRARLRAAAQQLAATRARVTDIALEVGFEDLSNFVRSFRAEFGVSPRQYRLAA